MKYNRLNTNPSIDLKKQFSKFETISGLELNSDWK